MAYWVAPVRRELMNAGTSNAISADISSPFVRQIVLVVFETEAYRLIVAAEREPA
jgi:hypothetical protein